MKVLVTGSGGYIGRHVLHALCEAYPAYEVIGTNLQQPSTQDSRVKNIEIDILARANDPALYTDLGEPDICIHLAWQDGFNHKANSHIDNLPAHYAFLKNMIEHGCRNISVIGTMHEIGYHEGEVTNDCACRPLSPYGIAKNALRQLMEAYLQDKDVSMKWLRAFYIVGDDQNSQSVFAKILQSATEGKQIFPFTDGKNKYDFISVTELGHQIARASVQTEINGIINVCSGQAVTLRDKVEAFIQENDLNIRLEYGAFPSRKYDSPAIWGNADQIRKIMQ